MRRRDLLRRLGTASALGIAGTGVAAADGVGGIRWQFDDGHVEEMDLATFRRRSDTPSVEELGGDPANVVDCCACQQYPIDCVLCYYPPCLDDPLQQ